MKDYNLINQRANTCRHGGHCEWVACDKCNHYESDVLNQQPCDDCISRQAVLDGLASIAKVKARSDAQKSLMGRIMFFVEQLPPVTPEEKTGKWIDDEFGSKCSRCGTYTHLDKFDRPMKFKYCSMCGAKMSEPHESEDKE